MGVKRKRASVVEPAKSSAVRTLAISTADGGASLSSRPKRREAQLCGICGEKVPIKMLAYHIQLELDQLRTLDVPSQPHEARVETTGRRKAAVQARQSLRAQAPRARVSTVLASDPTNLESTLTLVRRNRHERASRLREYGRSVTNIAAGPSSLSQKCPICEQEVLGDEDVVQAHVDACLAHLRLGQDGERETEMEEDGDEYEWAGQRRVRVTALNGFAGTGFDVLNHSQPDVEDELDIDGDDTAVFGTAQFGENDIVGNEAAGEGDDTENESVISESGERRVRRRTLRDLVADGKAVRARPPEDGKVQEEEVISVGEAEELDCAVATAKDSGNSAAVVQALEAKVKQLESVRVMTPGSSSYCRICLDPYEEPLVSSQCWHVHCKECWMRSLGVSKLCPQCKCITLVGSLRRVYL
ncbi:hypothetical protein CALVIDRAFT_533816 [Calocera viscosa TUFC12733]|uniref:RING-type domain-containing protein n=1 Tax=Calocera viscosa (strain TUFC12733) TaxID=1330018 RepID=A0A167QR79_CALVF|nr:hypothetical protein CALVIDRAFT_533816 [Calocera viscosa TUFC12733]